MKLVTWTKTYRFCAGHRLHNPARDDAWNRSTFGKCSYPGGHGHNYVLEVGVRGEPDPESGLVVREAAMDALIDDVVMARLDHRNLNDELSRDFGPAPTTEVLVLELWRSIADRVPAPARLHRIRVYETVKNIFEYRGPDSPVPA